MLNEPEIIGLLDGTLSPEELARLAALLESDPTARAQLREQTQMDNALRVALGSDAAHERVKQSVLAVVRGESEAVIKQQVLHDTTSLARSRRHEEAEESPRSPIRLLTSAATEFFASIRRPAWAMGFAGAACVLLAFWFTLRLGKHWPPVVAEMPSAVSAPTGSEWRRGKALLPQTGSFVPQPGDTLRVALDASGTVKFADGTVLHLEPGTEVMFTAVSPAKRRGGKQLQLLGGTISAEVAKQPEGLPLLIETPHALVTVVGTEFDLTVATNQTALEVTRGLVKLSGADVAQPINVAAGEFAVASPDALPRFGSLPRNPYLWPFSSASPWNTPIGSGAKYAPVPGRSFVAEGPLTRAVRGRPPLLGRPIDPLRKIWVNGQLRGDLLLNETALPQVASRDSLVFLQRSRRYAYELLEVAARPDGNLTATDSERTDLAGMGVSQNAVPALPFGLSNLGGLIRAGEYERGIPHALSARVNRERLSGRRNFSSPGTVWPATGGDPPSAALLNVGTLLAIPPDVDIRKLVGDSGPGYELARAMQDYGVYITGYIDAPFVLLTGEARLNRDEEDAMVNKLATLLKVVVNNTAQSPGGGGTPRREAAPALPGESK